MNNIISEILKELSVSENKSQIYLDLQGIIERYSQDLYSEKYNEEYLILFSKKEYLQVRLTNSDVYELNHFLFYNALKLKSIDEIYFNAKCIKALYIPENIKPICNLIKLYLPYNNDNIIATLLRAIMDSYNNDDYLDSIELKHILKLLEDTSLNETKYLIDFIYRQGE